MKIWGGALVRNESGRYLSDFCIQMSAICDEVIILDDASTDETPEICKKWGFSVLRSKESLWATNEVRQRKRLFNTLTSLALPGDWIIILDADELFHTVNLAGVKCELLQAKAHEMWIAYRLYDIWQIYKSPFANIKLSTPHRDGLGLITTDSTGYAYLYRNDPYWQAHNNYWPMAYRYTGINNFLWREQGLHCGRFPYNIYQNISPSNFKIRHMGWATLEDRKIKYDRYIKADPKGDFGILEQYLSILDDNPVLEVLSE